MTTNRPLLGAHFSVAGGVENAVADAVAHDCPVMQIFVKNASRWEAPPISDGRAALFRQRRSEAHLVRVAAHASYLINLASPEDWLWEKSIDALCEEAARSAQLGVDYLVVHPGAHRGAGEDEGLARIGSALDRIVAGWRFGDLQVALETTAGQGTSLGWRFEHFACLFERVQDNGHLAVCVDTCHVFAAGYDLRTTEGCERTFDSFDRCIGLEHLKLFHFNDSRRELASRVDRHANIGQGMLGEHAFAWILADRRFDAVPKILETPKGEDGEGDRRNLQRLRTLLPCRLTHG